MVLKLVRSVVVVLMVASQLLVGGGVSGFVTTGAAGSRTYYSNSHHKTTFLGATESDITSLDDGKKGTASTISRSAFLAKSTAAALFTFSTIIPSPAVAKQVDESLKGTKQDPSYEACVSQCLYECTKPKGMEQRSRKECLPECKQKCATTKQQLMVGTPINKE